MEEVKIFSNWNSDDKENLKTLLTLTSPEKKECEVDYVAKESCICLTKDENGNFDSKPEIEIKSKSPITEVNILSEGSLIEVFGLHDEYLFTCASEFIDDWEGMAVYHSKIILPDINSCKLKFTRIKEKGRLWLYSVRLSITKSQKPSQLSFNFENIYKLINSSSQQLSENAEKFKKFFELYCKNYTNQDFHIQRMRNVLSRDCSLQYLNYKQSMVDCLNTSHFNSFNENMCQKTESCVPIKNEFSVEYQFLKDFIDSKFMEIKDDLMKHMELKFQELKTENNAKLDVIIKLLEDSKL